ncbi:MAG: ABC transporter substrate-binding protein [Fastidiosipilaceae bacterium]|jgi:branched-chain amino acid transport system substrate-binding protein
MKKRLLAICFAALLVVTTFAGCGKKTDGGDTADTTALRQESSEASDGETFVLGGLAPLTGPVSVYGISTNNATIMAVEEINANGGINGMQIEYHVLDEQGDVTEATNAYGRLVSEFNIDALVGDVTSKPSISVAQRAHKDGMPMVAPTATADAVTAQGENVFRTCFTDAYQGKAMAAYVAKDGKKSAAILYDNSDDYSVALTDAFTAECEASGVEITSSESFGADDTEFKAQLTKIVSTDPEVLYVPAYYEKNALIMRQAKETGFEGVICGGDGWDGILTQFKDDLKGADGAIFSNHYSVYDEDPTVQNFIENYKEKYNEDPTAFSALGYDSVYLIKQAVEEAGTKDKAAVVEALKNIEFSGVTGKFTFDENRNPVKTVSFIIVEDGKYTLKEKLAAD